MSLDSVVSDLLLDDLADEVERAGLVVTTAADLLARIGRKRLTASAMAALKSAMDARYLAMSTSPTSGHDEVRIYRVDGALADVFDAVQRPSASGDAVLASYVGRPPDRLVRNLGDLLRLTNTRSMHELRESIYGDSDWDTWVSFPGDDPEADYFEWNPDRSTGIKFTTWTDRRYLDYPFDLSDFWIAAQEIEDVADFRSYLADFCPEADHDFLQWVYSEDLVIPFATLHDDGSPARLELYARRDTTTGPIAKYLRSGEIKFRLTPNDLDDSYRSLVRVTSSDSRQRYRIACPADDPNLAYNLTVLAS